MEGLIGQTAHLPKNSWPRFGGRLRVKIGDGAVSYASGVVNRRARRKNIIKVSGLSVQAQAGEAERYIKVYRISLLVCGALTIGLAAARLINQSLDSQPLDLRWLALAAFAVVGSWLAASQIPGAKSVVTVSDTFIFLTMLLCGPDA